MSFEDFAVYNQRGLGRTTAMLKQAINLAEENNYTNIIYVVNTHTEVIRLEKDFFPNDTMPANLIIANVSQESAFMGRSLVNTHVIFDHSVLELKLSEIQSKNEKLKETLMNLLEM